MNVLVCEIYIGERTHPFRSSWCVEAAPKHLPSHNHVAVTWEWMATMPRLTMTLRFTNAGTTFTLPLSGRVKPVRSMKAVPGCLSTVPLLLDTTFSTVGVGQRY